MAWVFESEDLGLIANSIALSLSMNSWKTHLSEPQFSHLQSEIISKDVVRIKRDYPHERIAERVMQIYAMNINHSHCEWETFKNL
jgi:hypothetical protein